MDEKEEFEADLTLSGHTHHGQMWSLNYITKAIYEVSWGPPVRIGNWPEIVLIHPKFKS